LKGTWKGTELEGTEGKLEASFEGNWKELEGKLGRETLELRRDLGNWKEALWRRRLKETWKEALNRA